MSAEQRRGTTNRATKITDALNQNTRFTYDLANGNLLSVIDPLTHATNISYNQFGQPTSVTDALNHTTTFEYDEVGNLIKTVDPLGNRTLRFYDAVSRLLAIVDARGKSTTFTYDNLNRVTQIQDAINGLTSFAYDPNGNLLTVTDAKNQTTTYTYDNMDRLATRKDALNRTESYQYDLAGNLTQFTDRKNQVTTFQYDALDRWRLATYADSTTVAVTYDAVGNVTRLADSASGDIEWAYDVLDRVTQEVTPQGIVRYTYDAIDRRLSLRANAQQPVTYGYDANSQLSQVTQGTLSATLTHDAVGRRTQLQRSNGVATMYNYDPASRLLGMTHAKGSTILEQISHGFDPADNKTQVAQLIQAATALPPAVTAAYDAANQQAQFAGATLGYDNNGNLTTDDTNTYVWDARDRLIGISGGTTATFSYDALDRRIAKTINGATSTYQYDGADVVTESGTTNASYLSTLNIDEPLVRQASNGNEYYHADDLGSTIALSDDTGAVTTRYTYGPFGEATITGASTNPFQFTGRENDGTGFYYLRARYYSSTLHRFITQDSMTLGESFRAQQIVEAESVSGEISKEDEIVLLMHSAILSNPVLQHPYLYGLNNPLRFTDPSGELVPQVVGCVIGAGVSIGLDVYSKKKISLLRAGLGCALGAGGGYLASIANANRYLRIGFGRHGGNRVFRLAGKWVQTLTGRSHIDIWRGGPL